MDANAQLRSIIPLVRKAAFGVKTVRRVRLYRALVEDIIRETEKNVPNETGFGFEKQYHPVMGVISYLSLKHVWPGEGGQATIWYAHLDPNEINSGHSHPFEVGALQLLSRPMSMADESFITKQLQKEAPPGARNLANNAHLILGGNGAHGWGIGVWTFDETRLAEDTDSSEAVLPERPIEVAPGTVRVVRIDEDGIVPGIYSLPIEVVDDQTPRLLQEKDLRRMGIELINNSKPYAEEEGPEDVTDIIRLREWLAAASSFVQRVGVFKVEGESTESYKDALRRILYGSSRTAFMELRTIVG